MSPNLLNTTVSKTASSVAYLTDFSDFLSFQDTVHSLVQLFAHIEQNDNWDSFHTENSSSNEDPSPTQLAHLIDAHSERILSLLQTENESGVKAKLKQLEPLKTAVTSSPKILGNKKYFQHLKFMLLHDSGDQASQPPVVASTSLNGTPEFENALINAILNEDLVDAFTCDLKNAVQTFGTDPAFMQRLLRALQKDYIKLNNNSFKRSHALDYDIQTHATSLISVLFPLLVDLAKKDLSYVSKNIIDFSFEMTNPNEEFRVITWTQWRWVRVLATHTWDASLREPPSWVIAGGSLYCAIIFDCADSIWLQEYAHLILERVYAETLVESFIPTQQHYDYVEFLVRNLKKKSPYFASHSDINLALRLISRLTPREQSRDDCLSSRESSASSRDDTKKPRHDNPISQALGVLLQMTSL